MSSYICWSATFEIPFFKDTEYMENIPAWCYSKAKSFGLYRYTSKTPEQHENNYTDWCCLLWFPFASFILLRPNRYLHFSSSDCGSHAKGKVSRNAYTELTQPAGAVFLFLLAFWAQTHTKTTPPPFFFSWMLSICFHESDVHVFITKMTNQNWITVLDFFLFLELLWSLHNSYKTLSFLIFYLNYSLYVFASTHATSYGTYTSSEERERERERESLNSFMCIWKAYVYTKILC